MRQGKRRRPYLMATPKNIVTIPTPATLREGYCLCQDPVCPRAHMTVSYIARRIGAAHI